MARTDFDYTLLRGNSENGVRIRTLFDHLTGPISARILEIGVGGGDSTEEIARRFGQVTCLDLSRVNLDVTTTRAH
jgi:2-polyprenyl-3-methyl-5-hydroxy-6-metoxy-1,4-benzoquinol methylase